MEWVDRMGALYQFLGIPAMAKDLALHGPQSDLSYDLAYGLQATSTTIDAYPADTQTLAA
jgi:hypothetical protein